MARLVTKFKYLKPNRKQSKGGYAKYIATREGVEKIDESFRLSPATVNQAKLIQKLVKDFPDVKEIFAVRLVAGTSMPHTRSERRCWTGTCWNRTSPQRSVI